MLLTQTKRLMDEKVREKLFDTYAVVVGINGQSGLVTSKNADKDTYFDIASMGKVLVTSTLILRAIGEGKLSLEDTLGKFYPQCPEDKKNITIKQMLTHTCGMERGVPSAEIGQQGSDAVAEYLLSLPLVYEPGTQYLYTCDGPGFLGFILEKIYGMPLDEVYYKYLTGPMGLKRSRFNISLNEENAAICYHDNHENRINCADDDIVYNIKNCVYGGGGSFSSAGDIEKFMLAVLNKDEVLYPKYLFDVAEKDYTPNFTMGRGLGYWLCDARYPEGTELFSPDSLTFGHIGYTGESFFINRINNMYVIILTNYERWYSKRPHDPHEDYMDSMQAMRQEVYHAIKEDLVKQNLLKV